jgi:hypothetical protein
MKARRRKRGEGKWSSYEEDTKDTRNASPPFYVTSLSTLRGAKNNSRICTSITPLLTPPSSSDSYSNRIIHTYVWGNAKELRLFWCSL